MRIALVNAMTPFVRGGAEILVDDLAEQLQLHGHNARVFRLPFPASYEEPMICSIATARMMRFDEYDRVIAFKFPAYCIRHPAKVIWMFHQFRQAYDLWGKEYGLQPGPDADRIRAIVRAADGIDIPAARHVYTNAQEVSKRLMKYNGFASEILPPPLKNTENYYKGAAGDYIFYPSRITSLKRQHLAIEALQYTKSKVKLVIAGISEPQYMAQLKSIIKKQGLDKRVKVVDGWISDEEKIRLMADSLAVIYIPYNEDSCGFVSMEGFYSHKPVISCNDSGGTQELIEDGKDGFITEPTPQDIATAMDKLYEDKSMAERMGEDAYGEIVRRNITWPETVRRLLL